MCYIKTFPVYTVSCYFFQSDMEPHKAMAIAQDLLPATFLLTEVYCIYIRLITAFNL